MSGFKEYESFDSRDSRNPKAYVTWRYRSQYGDYLEPPEIGDYLNNMRAQAGAGNPQHGNYVYVLGGKHGAYDALAFDAALLMGRERNDRKRSLGEPILLEPMISNAGAAYSADAAKTQAYLLDFSNDYLAALQWFIWHDLTAYYHPGAGRSEYRQALADNIPEPHRVTADGIPVITPELDKLKTLSESLLLEKLRDDLTLKTLAALGLPDSILSAVSARTATDPFVRWILDRVIRPDPPPEIHSGIAENINIPYNDANRLTQEEELNRLAFIGSTLADPIFSERNDLFGRIIARESKDQAEARDYDFWSYHYPKFEILASKNHDVPPAVLSAPWPAGTIPPFVTVTVTPRAIPRPKLGWLEENVAWLGPLISVVVPWVGWAISLILHQTASASIRGMMGHVFPTSIFAPQYEPVTPFDIVLPLNLAQYVVAHPIQGPAIAQWFAGLVRDNDIPRLRDALVSWPALPASAPGTAAATLAPIELHAAEMGYHPAARAPLSVDSHGQLIAPVAPVAPLLPGNVLNPAKANGMLAPFTLPFSSGNSTGTGPPPPGSIIAPQTAAQSSGPNLVLLIGVAKLILEVLKK